MRPDDDPRSAVRRWLLRRTGGEFTTASCIRAAVDLRQTLFERLTPIVGRQAVELLFSRATRIVAAEHQRRRSVGRARLELSVWLEACGDQPEIVMDLAERTATGFLTLLASSVGSDLTARLLSNLDDRQEPQCD